MGDAKLLESISIFLLRKGFTVKTLASTCFDLLARKGSKILLVKTLSDANSIMESHANEMIKLCSYIKASPLIIAEKAGNKLENNVVYSRLGIPAFNFNTFKNAVENKMPFIMSTKAGLTANIMGDKLKEKREELGFSLNHLSKKIGVSGRMIAKYENENSDITVSKAVKMYEIFGHEIFDKIDIFSIQRTFMYQQPSLITRKYSELGFDACETKKVPFDIIAKKDEDIILTEVGDKRHPEMHSISRILDSENLVIFDKKRPTDIPAVTREEFLEFEKANELIRFLKGF